MTAGEATALHTRLLHCALEVEDARAYWSRTDGSTPATPREAFEQYWFGARSFPRIKVLLTNLRARFAAFPSALRVLHRWPHMEPETRALICHWHLQLSDPLYRTFTGGYLVERRDGGRPEVTRDLVVAWVGRQGESRWAASTRVQFATNLLSAAHSAGLVGSTRDPRPLRIPRVPDDALEYVLHLLREISFEGTLRVNPYLRSVGLEGASLDDRLRRAPSLRYRRQADLVDYGWLYPSLEAWAAGQGRARAGAAS